MIRVKLKVELCLVGPLLVQASSGARLGLDAMMARDAEGRPYIPYSLIRGKLRQALEEIASSNIASPEVKQVSDLLHFWFGPRKGENDTDLERGALCFTDFVHQAAKDFSATQTRIQIDPTTGSAKERMLLVVDTPFELGEEAAFSGEVVCICDSQEKAEATVGYIAAGLKWIRQIGAERTVGFGRVKRVDVSGVELAELTQQPISRSSELLEQLTSTGTTITHRSVSQLPSTLKDDSKFLLRIRPHNPFCIGGVREGGNLIDSEEFISGGVILGTLATMWRLGSGLPPNQNEVVAGIGRWNALAEHFGKLKVSHAFPSVLGSNIRPVKMPYSLAVPEPWSADIPDNLFDVVLCSKPRLLKASDGTFRPPVFESDWKGHVVGKKVEELSGWPSLTRELRVRTAINADTLRAADEQLFAYHMVVPDKHEWLASIDTSDVPESDRPSVVADLIQLMSNEIGPLGKTKTWASVSLEPQSATSSKWKSSTGELADGGWVVTLQTSAVLCSTEALQDPNGQGLFAAYEATFKELSSQSLSLRHFFAKQTLAAPRFAGRLPTSVDGRYSPFVLTDAGSTFVLDATGDKAAALKSIESWLENGLPVRKALLMGKASDPDWRRCPYLNRHGFGEVVVNLPWLTGSVTNGCPTLLKDEKL